MNMFLLSSLSNMIIDSASLWVGGWWVGGSVGKWFADLTKPRKKHVWGSDFACALFVILILIFSMLTIKKKQI